MSVFDEVFKEIELLNQEEEAFICPLEEPIDIIESVFIGSRPEKKAAEYSASAIDRRRKEAARQRRIRAARRIKEQEAREFLGLQRKDWDLRIKTIKVYRIQIPQHRKV